MEENKIKIDELNKRVTELISINAKTEFVYDDGTIDQPDIKFEKEISIDQEILNKEFYTKIFDLLRDELLATF